MADPLATTHPHLLRQWHPTKNLPLSPNEITENSHRKVWWFDETCNHEWTAAVSTRTTKENGCAVCSGKQVLIGYNDLSTTHPEIAAFFHPSKNTPITLEDITIKSNATICWIGPCGHEWASKVNSKALGNGCPYCNGNKVLAGFNDLSTTHPDLAAQFHPNKNANLSLADLTKGSSRDVWWICESNHEWEARVSSRAEGIGCPYCSGRYAIPGETDVATLYPHLVSEWKSSNPQSLASYRPGSQEKGVWECEQGHQWTAPIRNRVNGSGCTICAKKKVLAGFNDVETVSPAVAAFWDYDKNKLKPSQMFPGSEKAVHLKCDKGHEWETKLSLTRDVARLCPVCAGRKALQGFNDLSTTHPHLAAEWHPTKNSLKLEEIVAGLDTKVWWLGACGHEWEMTVGARTGHQMQGCSVCVNRKILIGYNDLAFKNPSVAAEWHPTKNGTLLPTMVSRASNRKVWWICSAGHEWEAKITGRTLKSSGCPDCSNLISKKEQEIADFLIASGIVIEQSNRTVLNGMELDIYVPSHNFAIEFNGIYWHTEVFGKGSEYHYNKWAKAKASGIQLVQIWEDEWVNNPEQIKTMLLHKLGMSTMPKIYARKTKVVAVSTAQAEEFFEINHIQGFASASYYYGLISNTGLHSVLALKKEPSNVLNIIRYATNKNVVGGFTKLLNHAEKLHTPDKFITFSDNCVSNGGLYANNGFTADRELKPDYRYVVGMERRHKFGYRLKRFQNDPNLLWEPNLTEKQLADLNGLPRIWDAGKIRWVKEIVK